MDDRKPLTPAEQARTLEKLRALGRAAMFTPDDARVTSLVAEWSFATRMGSLARSDVAAIAAEFDRWGISGPGSGRTAARRRRPPSESRRPRTPRW